MNFPTSMKVFGVLAACVLCIYFAAASAMRGQVGAVWGITALACVIASSVGFIVTDGRK